MYYGWENRQISGRGCCSCLSLRKCHNLWMAPQQEAVRIIEIPEDSKRDRSLGWYLQPSWHYCLFSVFVLRASCEMCAAVSRNHRMWQVDSVCACVSSSNLSAWATIEALSAARLLAARPPGNKTEHMRGAAPRQTVLMAGERPSNSACHLWPDSTWTVQRFVLRSNENTWCYKHSHFLFQNLPSHVIPLLSSRLIFPRSLVVSIKNEQRRLRLVRF